MQRKKRSDDACLKRCTLKTGWCGCGRRLSASMPKTAQREAPRTVSSKVTGINAGQLFSGRHPILETKTANTTRQTAEQGNQGHIVAFQTHGFVETLDGKRRKGVYAAIAGLVHLLDGFEELFRSIKLRQHPVDMRARLHYFLSSAVSATSSRISAMEIAGKTRTNRNSKATNMPMVPMRVAQSQNVGQ